MSTEDVALLASAVAGIALLIAVWQYRLIYVVPADSPKRAVTPGRLVIWAIAVMTIWVVSVLVVTITDDAGTTFANVGAYVAWAIVAVLLIVAGVAKAVQIGVRSSRD